MRPSILLGFWRVHKCRAHVLRSLERFVIRWRSQGRCGAAWDDPLALGFLVTLITRLAQRVAGPLDPDAMGSLQGDLWGRLTGLPAEPLGERLVLLSAGQDPRFIEGCRRALIFATALETDSLAMEAILQAEGMAGASSPNADGQRDITELWDSLLADSR